MKPVLVENTTIEELKIIFDQHPNIFVRFIDKARDVRYDFVSNTKSSESTSFHSTKLIVYKNNEHVASVFWCSLGKLTTYLKSRNYKQ